MFSLEWLIGSGLAAALTGALIGYWISARSSSKQQSEKLETQLSQTQEAFEKYRGEVFEEFSKTASKFKTLNESYLDLHKHLAESANALCGEAVVSSLLEAPIEQTANQTVTVDMLNEQDELDQNEKHIEQVEQAPKKQAESIIHAAKH